MAMVQGIFVKECAHCKKSFVVSDPKPYVYKLLHWNKMYWYCRYNCWRAGEKKLKPERPLKYKDGVEK